MADVKSSVTAFADIGDVTTMKTVQTRVTIMEAGHYKIDGRLVCLKDEDVPVEIEAGRLLDVIPK